nr:unnamed protein product [Callosobruchus analis]
MEVFLISNENLPCTFLQFQVVDVLCGCLSLKPDQDQFYLHALPVNRIDVRDTQNAEYRCCDSYRTTKETEFNRNPTNIQCLPRPC